MRNLFLLLFIFPLFSFAQQAELISLTTGPKTSIRGLSVVSDQVTWVSGSNGYIGKTIDGGKTWTWLQAPGYEDLDFRDIEAFDQNKAIVVNAGSPAFVLLTIDGGKTWKKTYENRDSAIFLDGMDFWNGKQGMIIGDPIHNELQLLKTADGGLSWQSVSDLLNFKTADGEASFAASGTTIKTLGKGSVWIATGAKVSNIYFSADYGTSWIKYPCPIIQGESGTGPFSMDFFDEKTGLVVGGDYTKDKERSNNALITRNGGKDWIKPATSVHGYRSGVTYIKRNLCIAVGTSGVDLSHDGGNNWSHLSDLGFNAVKKAKKGNRVFLAGGKGEIYELIFPKG